MAIAKAQFLSSFPDTRVSKKQFNNRGRQSGSIDAAFAVDEDWVFGSVQDLDKSLQLRRGRQSTRGKGNVLLGDIAPARCVAFVEIPILRVTAAAKIDHSANTVTAYILLQVGGAWLSATEHSFWNQ